MMSSRIGGEVLSPQDFFGHLNTCPRNPLLLEHNTATVDRMWNTEMIKTELPILPRLLDIDLNPDAPWLKKRHAKFGSKGKFLCDKLYVATDCIENAPLNSRAWVRQERQLSRRTVHLSKVNSFGSATKPQRANHIQLLSQP